MIDTPAARTARWIVLLVPALLLGGAYLSQYGFGLYPCEMCWWQRWPHFASGLIGLFHAGVEYHWWQGITGCAAIPSASEGGSALDAIINTPLVRCDEAAWRLFGISLAGYNFLISSAAGIAAIWLLAKKGRRA